MVTVASTMTRPPCTSTPVRAFAFCGMIPPRISVKAALEACPVRKTIAPPEIDQGPEKHAPRSERGSAAPDALDGVAACTPPDLR
jgi:hypothetical protein